MKVLSKKKGYTLVEVIVCFALIGIFMSAAAVVLAAFTDATFKTNRINQSEVLANNLMTTVSAEIAGAARSPYDSSGIDVANPTRIEAVCISEDQNTLHMVDANGYHVTIKTSENQQLQIEYLQPNGEQGGEDGSTNTVDWDYGDGVYMDNIINELSFRQVNGANQIVITLKLVDSRTGYVVNRKLITECYNLEASNITAGE